MKSTIAMAGLAAFALHLAPAEAAILTTLASFNTTNGANPEAGLMIDASGTLFGTTTGGGAANKGTVFRLASDGTLNRLVSFTGTNGSFPQGALIADAAGTLYGTAGKGGAFDRGTVFSLSKDGTFTTLANFNYTNGERPLSTLYADAAGTLYGTTRGGGTLGQGTIFSIPSGQSLRTLVSFNGTNGRAPYYGALIGDAAGNLYGMTEVGGASGDGNIYRLNTNRTLTTLASFNRLTTGENPGAGLVADASGNFYGTTRFGTVGLPGGTLFQLAPDGTLTVLVKFTGLNGADSRGSLILDAAGTLFGTTGSGGSASLGTVFSLTRDGTFTTLMNFTGANGARPYGSLVADAFGNLYGTTFEGGSEALGTVYKLTGTGFAVPGGGGPAVPEPATWVMLITGFGLVGTAARRRRPVTAAG